MDVKCENCSTEYEFDDAKVTVAGITVKCTHCGHLFRVARAPSTDAPAAAPATRTRHWMIRNRHGEIREFRDLSTLQQWIVARKVSREDEISKTGETWKKLGSIVELAGVFSAVDSAASVGDLFSSPAGDLHSSAPPSAKPPPFSPDEVIPTGKFRLEGPRKIPKSFGDAPTVRVTRDHPQRPAPPPQPIITQSVPEQRTLSLPEVQQPSYMPPPQSNSNRGFLLGVMTTLALAGIGYFVYDAFLRPAETGPTAPPAAGVEQIVRRGEARYEKDTEAAFAQADADFAEAIRQLGEPPRDTRLAVRAHLGRARVALARAEYARAAESPHDRQLKIAGLALREVRRFEAASTAATVLQADLHRISGEADQAEKLLAPLQVPTHLVDEKQLIEAALPLERSAWREARRKLAALSEATLERPRARFLYAVSLVRAGRAQDATFELERLLARQPEHGPAQKLLADLRPNAPATVTAAVASATPRTAASVASSAPKSTAPKSAAPKSTAPKSAAPKSAAPKTAAPAAARSQPKKPRPTRSFDGLMKQARDAQEHGRTTQARRLLLQALSMKPGNAEALSSLGWCDVDEGAHARAITYFRRALRRSGGYAEARYGLAVAYERAGNVAEAKRVYGEYLTRHPKGRRRRIVERKVKTL